VSVDLTDGPSQRKQSFNSRTEQSLDYQRLSEKKVSVTKIICPEYIIIIIIIMTMIRTHVARSARLARMYLRVMKPRNLSGVPYYGPNTQLGTSRERKTEGTTDHYGTNFVLLKPVPSFSNPSIDFSTFYL